MDGKRADIWVLGNLTVDDVIGSDGTVALGMCGGNAIYAAVGARVWSDDVRLSARVGPDYPTRYLEDVARCGVRLELSPVQTPSIRNWALYEGADVRRFIPWLTSGKHLDQSLLPSELPREVCHARVCHVAPMPLSVQTQLVRSLHAGECVVSLDPHDEYLPGHEKDILDLLPMLTIFLPSRQEARLIFGGDQPEAAARAFAAAGSRIVVIKLGPEGSLVCDGASTAVHHVPAFETTVRDPTGAGDAYCGAFAVTFARIGDALAAARHASVAASFVVERLGAASVLPVNRAEAERRLRVLAPELEGATST